MREFIIAGVPLLVGVAVLLVGFGLEPRPMFHLGFSGAADIQLTNLTIAGLALLAGLASLVVTIAAVGL